jgi:hypothetical protein
MVPLVAPAFVINDAIKGKQPKHHDNSSKKKPLATNRHCGTFITSFKKHKNQK